MLFKFTSNDMANLLSDTLLAPLAIAVSPPDNSLVFSTQQWEIAKSTIKTIITYLSIGEDSLESNSVLIRCNKKEKKYDLLTLSTINLESLFNTPSDLLEELSTILPSSLEKRINNGNFDCYFETLLVKEESTENNN